MPYRIDDTQRGKVAIRPRGRGGDRFGRKNARSVACRLRDSEARFQHREADNFTIRDGEHDREIRFDELAVALELGCE